MADDKDKPQSSPLYPWEASPFAPGGGSPLAPSGAASGIPISQDPNRPAEEPVVSRGVEIDRSASGQATGQGRKTRPMDAPERSPRSRTDQLADTAAKAADAMLGAVDRIIGGDPPKGPPPPSPSVEDVLSSADLSQYGYRTGPRAEEAVSGHSAQSDSTWTGRFLDYLGLAFILVPPEPVVAALMKGEPIHWEVAMPLLLGAWAVGGALLYAGLTWPKWKPKNEAIASIISGGVHNIWVWVAVLLSIAFGPTILYSALSRSTIAIQFPACWDGKAPPCNDQPTKAAPKPVAGPIFHEAIPHAPPKLGPLSTLRMVDSIAAKGNSLSPSDFIDQRWALIITFPKESDEISMIVRRIVGAKLSIVPLPPPNANDLDAPKLIESGAPGIILHGNNQLNDRLFYELGSCFNVKKTARTPDNLQKWATGKIADDTQVTWIEIGPGSPWKEPFPCSE